MTIDSFFRRRAWPVLLALAAACAAQAQSLREDVALFDKPDGAAGAVRLKAGTAVKALKRQGFWIEVDAGGRTGWLKASAVNFAGATGGPTAIDTGRLGTGNIVATSAARGLSAKDLVSGKPDFEQASRLEGLAAQPAAAQAFLVAGGVVPAADRIQLATPRPAAAAAPAPGAAAGAAPAGTSANKKKGDDDW